MSHQIEFKGECRSCGMEMDGFIRRVPRSSGRITLFICRSCERFTGWMIWKKAKGECLRCDTPFTSYSSLPELEDTGAEEIHRCPSCGACYLIPMSGPVAARRLSPSEMKDLGL